MQPVMKFRIPREHLMKLLKAYLKKGVRIIFFFIHFYVVISRNDESAYVFTYFRTKLRTKLFLQALT